MTGAFCSAALLAMLLATGAGDARAQAGRLIHADNTPNAPGQQAKHYVVLVSLDGFRFDYIDKYGAPSLQRLAATGATAPGGMVPSYPSVTFPNHLSLVTGLYPEHHGIVANNFYDPSRGQSYSMRDARTVTDGQWYSGTPLWSLAESQGMRAAAFFWPGSEALIAGYRPDDYMVFDGDYPDNKRIDQVIAWLNEPEAARPHFITLYYADTDHAGHAYGPDSPEVKDAVRHVDTLMGTLRQRLDATGLPVDLIVVADHGMVARRGNWIDLALYADLSHFKTDGALLYPKTEADAEKAYEQFRAHPDPRFTAYRRADVPAYLHYNENVREGDPVIVPNGPFLIRAADGPGEGRPGVGSVRPPLGEHGYDAARMPEMRALFVANGPDIVPGTKLKSFANVDLYDFICAILDLKPAANDGELGPLAPALVSH